MDSKLKEGNQWLNDIQTLQWKATHNDNKSILLYAITKTEYDV